MRIIISGNRISDHPRVAIGINDCDDWDVQVGRFLYCVAFLVHSGDKQNVGQLGHFLDAAEEFVQSDDLSLFDHQLFLRLGVDLALRELLLKLHQSL